MSDDTRQLLHAASPKPAAPDDFDLVWARARRQRRVRQLAAVLGAAAVLAVAVVVLPGMLQSGTPGSLEIVGEPDQPGWPDVRGMTWQVPLDTIPQGVTAGVVEDRRAFFVRDDETVEVLLAAAQHLPNEGLWWCPNEQLFASPAHGELFDRDGRALFGPADRDLDRLASEIRGDVLLVDPVSVVAGRPAEPVDTISDVLPTARARAYEQTWAAGGFCAGHQPDHDPPTVLDAGQPAAPAPDSAVPVELDDVPQQLREVFVPEAPVTAIATDPTGSSDRQVFATPETDPPLMFGTSCDLVAAVPLPAGWLGYCLERTHDGQRLTSLFPWGTTSTPAAQQVHVPDVVGLALSEARQILRDLDLEGQVASGTYEGRAWQDPDDPDAVVVSQAPPAATLVRSGELVGFRTALIDPELCAVLTELPPRQGDAMALAASDSYWDVIERARPHAAEPLAGYLDELLAQHDAGLPTEEAPGKPIESVALHHDACSRR